MAATLVGYCRCSTDAQDLTAQRQRLRELGVTEDRIYLDHGLTGTNRARPGLDQALAALREDDNLVVPKERLARTTAAALGKMLCQCHPSAKAYGDAHQALEQLGRLLDVGCCS